MKTVRFFFVSLFIVLILVSANALYAQTYKGEFGIEGGVGIRSLRIDPKDSSTKTGIGFMGGIAGQLNLSPTFSLRLGVGYERKGADLETKIGTTTVKGKANIDYVAIPLLLRANFGNGKKIKFFLNAGPYVGILLANKIKTDAYGTIPESEFDNKDSTKKIDFGISGGIGINFLVGTSSSFTIGARDNFGLTNINDEKTAGASEIKTNSAQLILGFAWKFGKNYTTRK
ncbi:MAG: porin family protein [bacterium]